MGPFAVPSALAIGSITPDLWYFIPFAERADSHSIGGLATFCLPIGVLVYALFHLFLKQPLIALLSPRLGAFTPRGLPRAPWYAVAISLVAGALTHLAWDDITHSYDELFPRFNWLQHGSTLLGTTVLAWWAAQKLREVPPAPALLSPQVRRWTIIGLAATAAFGTFHAAQPPSLDHVALRHFVRSTGFAALHALAVALFIYCLLFQRKMLRRAS